MLRKKLSRRSPQAPTGIDLSTSIGPLELAHPIMLASGPLSVTYDQLVNFGVVASAVVVKSTSRRPSEGSPQPRIVPIDRDGMLNYEGGPNPGIDAFSKTMRAAKSHMKGLLIGSMSSRTLRVGRGTKELARKFEAAGVEAIEINFKYTYDQGSFRTDFNRQQIFDTVSAIRRLVSVPLIVKLPLGPTEIAVVAKTAEDAGASAITAINTVFPGMKISIRRRVPMLSMKYGGLSGAPIRPLAMAAVFLISEAVDIPVIASGGAYSGEDVVEFLMAGASAVQIFTVAMAEKEAAFTRIVGELEDCLVANGIGSVREAIGLAPKDFKPKKEDKQWASFLAEEEVD